MTFYDCVMLIYDRDITEKTRVYEVVPRCSATLDCPLMGGCGFKRCHGHHCEQYIIVRKIKWEDIPNIGKNIFLDRKDAIKEIYKAKKVSK